MIAFTLPGRRKVQCEKPDDADYESKRAEIAVGEDVGQIFLVLLYQNEKGPRNP
jgi:hypothetical protein